MFRNFRRSIGGQVQSTVDNVRGQFANWGRRLPDEPDYRRRLRYNNARLPDRYSSLSDLHEHREEAEFARSCPDRDPESLQIARDLMHDFEEHQAEEDAWRKEYSEKVGCPLDQVESVWITHSAQIHEEICGLYTILGRFFHVAENRDKMKRREWKIQKQSVKILSELYVRDKSNMTEIAQRALKAQIEDLEHIVRDCYIRAKHMKKDQMLEDYDFLAARVKLLHEVQATRRGWFYIYESPDEKSKRIQLMVELGKMVTSRPGDDDFVPYDVVRHRHYFVGDEYVPPHTRYDPLVFDPNSTGPTPNPGPDAPEAVRALLSSANDELPEYEPEYLEPEYEDPDDVARVTMEGLPLLDPNTSTRSRLGSVGSAVEFGSTYSLGAMSDFLPAGTSSDLPTYDSNGQGTSSANSGWLTTENLANHKRRVPPSRAANYNIPVPPQVTGSWLESAARYDTVDDHDV